MYVEEIISPDHTGVFLFYLKKTFLLAALHIYQYLVMENILILKLVPTLFSTVYLIYLLVVLIFQGFFSFLFNSLFVD